MKKQFVSMALVCAMVLFGAGMSLAGQGNGVGGGTGPIPLGTFEFSGVVLECSQAGGLTLLTNEGEVVLYGIGPVYYWESQGVSHPAITDSLTAKGYTFEHNGIDRNVVTEITINIKDDEYKTVVLRDPVTGKPLWRGTNGFSAGPGSTGGSRNSGNVGGNAGSGGSGGSATSGG